MGVEFTDILAAVVCACGGMIVLLTVAGALTRTRL
jgi:hypothetical protein